MKVFALLLFVGERQTKGPHDSFISGHCRLLVTPFIKINHPAISFHAEPSAQKLGGRLICKGTESQGTSLCKFLEFMIRGRSKLWRGRACNRAVWRVQCSAERDLLRSQRLYCLSCTSITYSWDTGPRVCRKSRIYVWIPFGMLMSSFVCSFPETAVW